MYIKLAFFLTNVILKCRAQNFITLRYYGRETDRFKQTTAWPDASEVCRDFVAVCVDLPLLDCVEAPPELRAPWTRNVTERDAGRYIYDPPKMNDHPGYLMMTNFNMRYEQNNLPHPPYQLFSGCDKNCNKCTEGTGVALHPATLAYTCRRTEDDAVFATIFNPGDGSIDTHSDCVPSLRQHYQDLDDKNQKTTMIMLCVGGGIMLVIVSSLVFVIWRVRRQNARFEDAMIAALQEGRATFQVGGFAGGSSSRAIVTQSVIEKRFPIITLDTTEICVVCLEPLSADSQCRQLQCNHVFHAQCILQWWVHRPRQVIECPTCKRKQEVNECESEQPEVVVLGNAGADEDSTRQPQDSDRQTQDTVPDDTSMREEKSSPGMHPGLESNTTPEEVAPSTTTTGDAPCNIVPSTP